MPIQTFIIRGIASWKVLMMMLKFSVLPRYFVIDAHVQKAPAPIKTSLYPNSN